ncbi:LysR family transcriptional regulator [Rhodococcus erythropolis]|uniref:LysR family transcriptional regulator n=1 Tax=Rhodococcus erythropolis TaxID=1833 RepID=UPI003822BCDF
MEFRQLEYFLAVVENGGIKGAALKLGVAQPTVSQSVRGLERELGLDLFYRIGRGLVPTAAGKSLIGPCRQILREVGTLEERLSGSADEISGCLDLMIHPALATDPIVELVVMFRSAHPRSTVRFADLKSEEAAAALICDGHCEFVVAHLPFETGMGLEVIELGEQEYWLAYPPGTELPPGPMALTALPDIPLVLVPQGGVLSEEITHAMRRAGVRRSVAVFADHRETRLPLVLAGVGGSFVERSLAESVNSVAVVRECDPTFNRPFGIAFVPESLSKAGQAFVDLLRSTISF